MSKILFVTSYPLEYNTSANVRNLGLIEGFIANNHEVSTCSLYPSDINLYSGTLIQGMFKDRYWIGGESHQQVSAKPSKRGKWHNYLRAKIANLYNYFSIYDRRKAQVRKVSALDIKETFDVIISSSDPKSAHLFAEELLKKNPKISSRWIQYWGDPFSDDISCSRFMGNMRVKREEFRLIKLASKVVYVSPFTADDIKKKYPEISSKIEFYPIPYRLSISPKKGFVFNKDIVIGYTGDYNSRNRNILPLYEALNGTNYKSYIVGNSDIKLKSTENIIVKERLFGDEFKRVSDEINIVVCICNLHGTQIPGKVYHCVNTGKPILIIVDGENSKALTNYFAGYDRFYTCDNNANTILACIEKIIKDKKSFNTPVSLNPLYIAQKFIQPV